MTRYDELRKLEDEMIQAQRECWSELQKKKADMSEENFRQQIMLWNKVREAIAAQNYPQAMELLQTAQLLEVLRKQFFTL